MYLLKKAIQLRENSHPDHEKPFLEHLEDLRTMLTRIVITLVIAMIACFAFNKTLMGFFRAPVDQVLVEKVKATLPSAKDTPHQLTVDRWVQARKIENAAIRLDPGQRESFYQSLGDDTLVFDAKSVSALRAAMLLPEARRDKFVESLPEPQPFKAQVRALIKTKPDTDVNGRGDLKMMSALKPTEAFMLSMKLSFVAGIVVAFPLLRLFILQFVLPGLHSHEKRVLWPAMAVGFGLFLSGAAMAYYMVLPRALLFFAQWSDDMGISNDWRIGEYISFATQFTLLFGLSFELPVVVMVFVKLGLLTYETMSKTRTYAIVAIFVAAAILTPTPDAFTMLLMAAPMIILYEICIWLAYFDQKKARLAEEQEARESEERRLARLGSIDAEVMDEDVVIEDEYHDSIKDREFDTADSKDDGWDEYPEKDPHSDLATPVIEDPLPDLPETEERRRMDSNSDPLD